MVTPNYDQPYYDEQNPADITVDLEELRHIAIAGAGAAGVAQIGAIMALDKAGLLDKVEDYAGTSAGAILAAPCAFGYSGDDLKKIVMEQEFTSFLRSKRLWKVAYNLQNYGIYSGGEIRAWVGRMAAQRLGDPDITFTQLKEYRDHSHDADDTFFLKKVEEARERLPALRRYFGKNFTYDFANQDPNLKNLPAAAEKLKELSTKIRNLHVIGAKVVKEPGRHNPIGQYEEVVFNHANEDYAHVRISHAVRASASFPFVFRLATIRRQDGTIEKFSDGGMCRVIPLNIFDEDGKPNPHALAIRAENLTPTTERDTRHVPITAPPKISRLYERVGKMVMNARQWVYELRRKQAEKTLGKSVIENPDTSLDWKEEMAAIFFGAKTTHYAAERVWDTLPDFMKNPDNKGRILLVDRGNVDTTDFLKCTQLVKEWMLNSGVMAGERLINYQQQQKAAAQETKEVGGGGPGVEEGPAGTGNKKWADQDFINTKFSRVR